MPSELLIETVAMLKQRIEIRGDYLARNEVPTRQMLIDPVLRALGWDFEDTERVSLEHPSGRGRMDYGLFLRNRIQVAVEAKRFSDALTDEAKEQAYGYAVRSGATYAVVTNGDRWEMFDTFRHWSRNESQVSETEISSCETEIAADRLNRISYATLESESFIHVPRLENVGE